MTNEKYLKQLDGLDVKYYDVKSAVEDIKAGSFAKLNYTSRVLAENLLRKCPSADLKDSLIQLIEKRTDKDFPDLEFRYCSKCDGAYEYCSEHLYTHKHIVAHSYDKQ